MEEQAWLFLLASCPSALSLSRGAFADGSSKGRAQRCQGLLIPLSFLTPHLALTRRALGCGSASGVPELSLCPGRAGAVPLLPPQLGQLLAAVSAGMGTSWGFSSQLLEPFFSYALVAAAAPLLPEAPVTLLWLGPGTIPCLFPSLGETSEPHPNLVVRHSQYLPHPEPHLDVQTSYRCLKGVCFVA